MNGTARAGASYSSRSKIAEGAGAFTGCGKTRSGEGYGLQPVHYPFGMSRALAPEGQLSLFSARIQALFPQPFQAPDKSELGWPLGPGSHSSSITIHNRRNTLLVQP